MSDLLSEFYAESRDLHTRWGVEVGWVIALWKDKGIVPDDADDVSVVITKGGRVSIWWRYDDGEWVHAGSTE